jgi:REP element-mobilizing transposase RayT
MCSFHLEKWYQKLGADFYFATSYHSWERGLNEHTNGLLRQFFAKRTNLKILKPEQVERAVSSRRYKQAAYPKSDGKDALWSPSYFVSSVGGVPLAVLKCYIRDQEKLS